MMWKGFLFSCSMMVEPDLFLEIEREWLLRELSAERRGCHANTSPSYEFETEQQCLQDMWLRAIESASAHMFDGRVNVTLKGVVCIESA